MTTPSVIRRFQGEEDRAASPDADVDLPIVLRAREGDHVAIACLWNKYQRHLFRYFARSISSAEEAEDLTSETLWAALQRLDSFRGHAVTPARDSADSSPAKSSQTQCSFQTYLYTIGSYKLAHWIRRKKTHRCIQLSDTQLETEPDDCDEASSFLAADDIAIDPLAALLRREHLDTACYALADVGMRSGEQFKALLFHYLCGLPHKEVAELLGTRRETINTRLQEARQAMRDRYGEPLHL